MKPVRGKLIEVFFLLIVIICYILSCLFKDDPFVFVKLWSMLTLVVIYAYLRFQKRLVIFAPLNLFCIYYITVVFVNFYYLSTECDFTPYLQKTSLHNNYIYLFNWSSFYYFAGLVSIIAGYTVLNPVAFKPMTFDNEASMSSYVLMVVALSMMGLGALNFFYNVVKFAGGNPVAYLSQVALRKYQFEDGGTTIGYIMYYMGTYLLSFQYLRKNKKPDLFFILCIFGGVILWASNGRIASTVFYLVTVIILFYYKGLLSLPRFNNRKYLMFTVLIPVFGIFFYFFRLLSSMSDSGMALNADTFSLLGDFFNSMSFYIIDKGNMPNTVIFIKVLDAWKIDHGFMYGESLVSWIMNILPSKIRPENYQPSAIIKQLWYSHAEGGHLPPTGVAEMYINFGPFGPFVGMFFLGLMIKLFYNAVIKSASFWSYLILAQISVTFIMLYPKGEFDNLNLIYVFFSYFPMILVKLFTSMFKVPLGSNRKVSI